MGLLVSCRSPQGRALIDNLLGSLRKSAAVCIGAAELMHQVLDQREPFQWILVEGEASGPEEQQLTRMIRERLADVPITFFSFPPGSRQPLAPPPALLCALENTPRGRKVLNCRLVEAGRPAWPPRIELTDLLYEYQAPVATASDSDAVSSTRP